SLDVHARGRTEPQLPRRETRRSDRRTSRGKGELRRTPQTDVPAPEKAPRRAPVRESYPDLPRGKRLPRDGRRPRYFSHRARSQTRLRQIPQRARAEFGLLARTDQFSTECQHRPRRGLRPHRGPRYARYDDPEVRMRVRGPLFTARVEISPWATRRTAVPRPRSRSRHPRRRV